MTSIIIPTILSILAYILGRFGDSNKQIFDTKLKLYSEIVYEINSFIFISYKDKILSDKLEYKNRLIKLFAPARLIGNSSVVNEIREYFSLIGEYFDSSTKESTTVLLNKITKSTMELEQCMRKDLFRFRYLSRSEIIKHLVK